MDVKRYCAFCGRELVASKPGENGQVSWVCSRCRRVWEEDEVED